MGRMKSNSRFMPPENQSSDDEVIEGKIVDSSDPQLKGNPSHSLPHSGSHMLSSIGKELDPNIYAKSSVERQAMDEEKNAGA